MQKGRLVLLSCVFILSVVLSAKLIAQPPSFYLNPKKTPALQEQLRRADKTTMRSFWNGSGMNMMIVPLLDNKELRDAWNISDEQHRQIQSSVPGSLRENPEFVAVVNEVAQLNSDGKLFSDDVDQERIEKFGNLQEKMTNSMMDTMAAKVNEILTPEQKRYYQEFQLAAMSESPFITPTMFEALDLSDEQKNKMKEIKKTLDPEFDKLVDEFLSGQMKIKAKVWETLEKEGLASEDDKKKRNEAIISITQQMSREDDDYQKVKSDLRSNGQRLLMQLKFKMFDVLTDEQLGRLQEIVDNPPEYARKIIERLRKRFGDESNAEKTFFDAWKPGDPIPEEYKEHRKRKAFPLKEK